MRKEDRTLKVEGREYLAHGVAQRQDDFFGVSLEIMKAKIKKALIAKNLFAIESTCMNPDIPFGVSANSELQYLQKLADGAPVMIWMSGADMGCFYFNQEWLAFRGRTLSQEFGNGWAEGVHPEDLQRCVQHYVGSFERRLSFAMSYRLLHHSGEYRWILDRGAPHYDADGEFLGFYGGCAETPPEAALERIKELRAALRQMREFAECLALEERRALDRYASGNETLLAKSRRLHHDHRAREHAACELKKLAADMLVYDRIPNGVCLQ